MRYPVVFMVVTCTLAVWQAQAIVDGDAIVQQMSLLQTTTQASSSKPVVDMQQRVQRYLQKALQGSAPLLTRSVMDNAPYLSEPWDDVKWLKAANYPFNSQDQQQDSIPLLSGFNACRQMFCRRIWRPWNVSIRTPHPRCSKRR